MDPYRDAASAKNVIELSESGGRLAIHREAVKETRGTGPIRRLLRRIRSRHLGYHDGLTDLDCRLPNGQMGKAEAVLENGEWVLVCRLP